MLSSRFPHCCLGRLDVIETLRHCQRRLQTPEKKWSKNNNLAESYIYIELRRLILSLTNSYIYNFQMFLVYLPALCHRRDECFTKTEQQTIPCSRLRKRLLHFDRLFYSIASSCHIIYLQTKLLDLGNYLLNHICCVVLENV